MTAIPWNSFHFIGYVMAVSIVFAVVVMDTLIFFCTMTGLLPIFVRTWESKIRVYSILMATLGASFILFGILTITDKYTEKEILSFMTKKWADEDEQFWDTVQMEYKCCGLNEHYNYDSTAIPASCCADHVQSPCTVDNAYRTYCYNAVTEYHDHLVIVLATIAFTLSFLCLVLIVLAQFSKRVCGWRNETENVSVL